MKGIVIFWASAAVAAALSFLFWWPLAVTAWRYWM
jgi:hypothetical protein